MQEAGSNKLVHFNGNGNGNGKSDIQFYPLPGGIANHGAVEEEESLELRKLLQAIKHRTLLIAVITLGVTTAMGFWTFSQKPKYKGTFHLLVEPVTEEKQSNPANLFKSQFNNVDYDTQIEVLRSSSILEPILQKIAQKYPDLSYKKLIEKPKKSPLQVKQLKDTKILEISFEDKNPQKIQFLLQNLAQAYLQYSLQERKTEINQGMDFVENQLPRLRNKVDSLQETLQKFRQTNNLLNPEEQATELSKQLVEAQQEYFQTQVKIKETASLYEILQHQLGLEPNRAIAASYLTESPRYQNLLNQLQQVEIELASKKAIFNAESPVIQDLEEKRKNLLPLLRQEAENALGNKIDSAVQETPSLANPSSLRLELNQQYVRAANDLQIFQLREKALSQALIEFTQQIRQMPLLARRYTDIQRELAVATENLNRFLVAEQNLQLESAQKTVPWQIISQPKLPEEPISPKPLVNMSLGVIAGLILGICAALLAERLDPVFHSLDELKEEIPLPILGLIPVQKDIKPLEIRAVKTEALNLPQIQIGDTKVKISPNNRPIVSSRNWYNASPFLESFRSLNTNIRLLGSDSPINSIVISSSIPSEGKSTISTHLAQAAAAMGQKVLLVDADLRRPQVHRWFGINNEQGLSNAIATGLPLAQAIQKLPYWENLDILTSGDVPPDPTRLLASMRMEEMMEELKNEGQYDLIIYDTPPILGFADGRILASKTNGVVLVVKIGKTDRALLKQNLDTLKISHVSVLGLIANNVNRNTQGHYRYYGHYYSDRK